MTSSGQWAANATAPAVLPMPVGPTMTGVLAPAKPALQLLAAELYHAGASVNVVRRQGTGEESGHQPAHFLLGERFAGLDRGTTGIGRSEAFEPVGPSPETATSKIGDQLAQAALRIEAGMRRRHGVDHDAPASEGLDLEADAGDLFPVGLDGFELLVGDFARARAQQSLARSTPARDR